MSARLNFSNFKDPRWMGIGIACVGLFLRAAIALLRTDSVWADETFQTLEPASLIVFGHGYLAWEWQSGYRTWVVPGIFMPILWIAKVCGLKGGLGLIALSRLWMAALSGLVLWSLFQVSRQLGARRGAYVGLLFYVLSPAMILWSVTTLADSLAMVAIWAVLPWILDRVEVKTVRSWFSLGILVGLPFLMKVQTGSWILGLGFCLLFVVRPDPVFRRMQLLGAAVCGVLVVILALGCLDWLTWGGFLQTAIKQVTQGAHISHTFGDAPWYFYFPQILENQGLWFFGLLGALGLFWLRVPKNWQGMPQGVLRIRFGIVFFPLVCFLSAHLCIDHKELRFLLPVFPLFYVLVSIFSESLVVKLQKWHGSWVKVGAGLGFCGMSALAFEAANMRPLPYSTVDSSAAESAIYEDGGLAASGRDCILLVDHNWSFTRGEMILGERAHFVEVQLGAMNPAYLAGCKYAVLPISSEPNWIYRVQGSLQANSWQLIFRSEPKWGQAFALYRNLR